jgi:hypothetical protein
MQMIHNMNWKSSVIDDAMHIKCGDRVVAKTARSPKCSPSPPIEYVCASGSGKATISDLFHQRQQAAPARRPNQQLPQKNQFFCRQKIILPSSDKSTQLAVCYHGRMSVHNVCTLTRLGDATLAYW